MRVCKHIFPILIVLMLASGMAQAAVSEDKVLDEALSAFDVSGMKCEPESGSGGLGIQEVIPTFLFVRENDQLYQLAKLMVKSSSSPNVLISVSLGSGKKWEAERELKAGQSQVVIQVPDVEQQTQVTITVSEAQHESTRINCDWQPARKWTVYVTHMSHLDWGYTGTQEEVADKRELILNTALQYMKDTADWPDDARFRYTADGALEIKNYLDRHPDSADELKAMVQSGRMEVNAKLAHLCSSTASYEELARELYYSKRELEPLFDRKIETAIHSDVPGLTWGDVTILAGAGVKYLLFNPNLTYRGSAVIHEADFPQAFYWQGPDGQKILTWRSWLAYSEGRFLIDGIDKTAAKLPALLLEYENKGYPYDVLHLTRSGLEPVKLFEDNSMPRLEISESIREWNSRFAYPRLVLAVPSTFFRELEKRYGDSIPTFSGDMPDWWADGVLTNAKETGDSRLVHFFLPYEEIGLSLANLLYDDFKYPSKGMNDDYFNSYMFDEHTWGNNNPFLPRQEKIWNNKQDFLSLDLVFDAEDAGELLASAAAQHDDEIVVFNFSSKAASGTASIVNGYFKKIDKIDNQYPSHLEDIENGQKFPFLSDSGMNLDYLIFDNTQLCVKDIPPFGYRTYRLVDYQPSITSSSTVTENTFQIENKYFTLQFDKQKGGLISLVDKKTGRQLIDDQAKYRLGQLVERRQGPLDLYDLRTAARLTSAVLNYGPVYDGIEITYELMGIVTTFITCEFRLYHELPYIDLKIDIENYHNGIGENKYIAFPFALPQAEVSLDVPYSVMRPGIDQLPGFASYYAVAHWVDIHNRDGGVIWSTFNGPMVELGQIRKKAAYEMPFFAWKFYTAQAPDKPYIFSEIMNNFQNTNYNYQQRGSASWFYRIRPYGKDEERVMARRSGWEFSQPLVAVQALEAKAMLPPSGSFISVSPDSVIVTALKKAEDGHGFILRLFESGGGSVKARVSLPLKPITRAFLTDIVERDINELTVKDHAIEIDMPMFSVRTVRVLVE